MKWWWTLVRWNICCKLRIIKITFGSVCVSASMPWGAGIKVVSSVTNKCSVIDGKSVVVYARCWHQKMRTNKILFIWNNNTGRMLQREYKRENRQNKGKRRNKAQNTKQQQQLTTKYLLLLNKERREEKKTSGATTTSVQRWAHSDHLHDGEVARQQQRRRRPQQKPIIDEYENNEQW